MADDPLTTTVDETKQVLTLATVAFEADPDREDERVLTDEEATTYRDLMYGNECDDIPIGANGQNDKADCRSVQVDVDGRMVRKHIRAPKMAVKAGADRPVDPSFVMAQIGYTIGDTSVAASWYKSEDFVWTGSEGTAIGFGVSHALPKVNATIHAAVQRYEVDFPGGATEETVFQLGTVVTF